jgi:hypothetical protein
MTMRFCFSMWQFLYIDETDPLWCDRQPRVDDGKIATLETKFPSKSHSWIEFSPRWEKTVCTIIWSFQIPISWEHVETSGVRNMHLLEGAPNRIRILAYTSTLHVQNLKKHKRFVKSSLTLVWYFSFWIALLCSWMFFLYLLSLTIKDGKVA